MPEPRAPRLCVLIDADNVPSGYAEAIFEEIASLGEASVRRIYGDWSAQRLAGWAKQVAALGLVADQQFSNTKGKNASDIGLVIAAMDFLHSGLFDGFVLVSSDSDFTRLAARIREQGLDVYGIGEKKTPEAFRMDICAATPGPVAPIAPNAAGVTAKTIAGGRYAVLRHVGSNDTLDQTVAHLYAEWLPASGEEPRDVPLVFQRVRFYPDVPEHEAVTDVLLPLR